MTDQKDPALKLFGRVIPLAPDAAAPAAAARPEAADQPPVALPDEADENQLKKIEDTKDNERKVDVPQEKEDNVMKVDAPQETQDNAMKVDAPQEKEDTGMKVDAPQEKQDNGMKVDAPQEKEDTGMKVDVLQEKGGDELRVDAPQVTEKVELVRSSTSDHKKEDQGQMNNAEGKAASDSNKENEKTEEDEQGQDKVLKKPDKIIPCPRCNSMDTKFCYYNNYNINQPRHFCKNCQRYWTAGGTMRNVPVGAGRRKSKNASLHYRHLLMPPDCMMGSGVDISKSVNPEGLVGAPSIPMHPNSRNERVLKFGPEVPLCESMSSVLNIEEQKVTNGGSAPKGENGENNSCPSSITSHNGLPENLAGAPVYCNGVGPVPQYYLGAPFMYPWSIGWNNLPMMVPGKCVSELSSPSESCSTSSTPWMNSPMMPPASGLAAPPFPYPLVPPALWGCLSSWPATPWSMPWIGTNSCISPSSSSNSSCSGNGSPLGKHSRDSNPLKEDKEEKSLWVPKTLRIDDPDEAAKSSIWATLGIKPGEPGSFKPFQSKNESKGQASDVHPARVLHANPAAFSRSQTFQEGS